MAEMTNIYNRTPITERRHLFPDYLVDTAREQFDAEVLPLLLDPAKFMALAPVVRLRAVIDFVTMHPEKHNQAIWGLAPITDDLVPEGTEPLRSGSDFLVPLNVPRPDADLSCGTSHCVAGWGANFAGVLFVGWGGYADPNVDAPEVRAVESLREEIASFAAEWNPDYENIPEPAYGLNRVYANGRESGVSDYARDLFGLSEYGASDIFAGSNSLSDLRAYMEDIENGDPCEHLGAASPTAGE